MKILITSGGTKIPIDLVRSITNMSRGTFGSRICDAFWMNTPIDTRVTFLYAKDSRMPELLQTTGPAIKPVRLIEYKTFDDYKGAIEKLLSEEQFDIICLAAAVSDYGVENVFNGKYRSREDEMTIKLVKLPKVITEVRKLNPGAILCGFKWLALEAEEEEPKPCPFCGGMTEVITDEQGYCGVSCIHCNYTSERYRQSIYAIAAHNRVCRAVEAVKKG